MAIFYQLVGPLKRQGLLLFCVLLMFSVKAQLGTSKILRGLVQDSVAKPLGDAVISLMHYKTNALIKMSFAESNGTFELSGFKNDSVKILVTQIGYANHISQLLVFDSLNTPLLLAPITLYLTSKTLQEVTVSTKVAFVERKADRTIINPEGLISAAGSSALDVLAKAPGVQVDQNGNIKLKGKAGVLVLIDDKPTYLTATELENYLRSIPAASVKQFELMPNPPAHYEAAGNAGIINIRTKKTKLKGINGNVSLNYAQGRYARSTDNFMLNYTTQKFSIFSNVSYSTVNRFQDLNIYRRYKKVDETTSSLFNQNTYIKIGSNAYTAKLAADYYLSPKTTLGISVKGLINQSDVSKYNYANLLDSSYQLNAIVIADNRDKNKFTNGTFNLNLRHQIDSTGKELTFDADYVPYTMVLDQTFKNTTKIPDGNVVYQDQQNGQSPVGINIYAFKSDYTQPLGTTGKLDAGVKSAFTQTDNKANYTKTLNGVTAINYALSNQFLYEEWINAAYINYTKSFKHLDVQGGLRFESTVLKGKQLGNVLIPSSTFNRDYHNLFPTLFVTYKMDSAAKHVWSINYGRRIDRAFYKDLNPFVNPLDQYTFYAGNTYLQPTFTHNAALAYTFKNAFTTTFTYSKIVDKIQETIEINNGIYYSRPGNIGSSEMYNLSVEGTIPCRKWLTTTVYSELVYAEFRSRLYTELLNSRGTYWYINVNNSIVLKKGWSAEVSVEYLSNVIDSQFAFGDYGHGTLGIQKRILKDKGSFKLSLSDVLYSIRIRGTINNLKDTDANWTSVMDSRVASATFSYRFGKNVNKRQRHTTNGSESEQNRVKS